MSTVGPIQSYQPSQQPASGPTSQANDTERLSLRQGDQPVEVHKKKGGAWHRIVQVLSHILPFLKSKQKNDSPAPSQPLSARSVQTTAAQGQKASVRPPPESKAAPASETPPPLPAKRGAVSAAQREPVRTADTDTRPPVPLPSSEAAEARPAASGNSPTAQDIKTVADYYSQGLTIADPAAFAAEFIREAGLSAPGGGRPLLAGAGIAKVAGEINKDGDPIMHDLALIKLAKSIVERQKNGDNDNSAHFASVNDNDVHFAKLQEITKHNPVETADGVVGKRFANIGSPLATNIQVSKTVTDKKGNQTSIRFENTPANRVDLGIRGHHAIASQYPANTAQARENFWLSQLDNQTNVIFDLTKPEENNTGKTPLDPYYPTVVSAPVRYGNVSVTLVHGSDGLSTYEVKNHQNHKAPETIHRYHYKNWPDKTAIEPQELSRLADVVLGQTNTCVHCRAGVGRTMTTYAAADLLNQMRNGKIASNQIDKAVDDTILKMREARGPQAVQTATQRASLVQMVQLWFKEGTPQEA